ncbi:hypothetical protein EMCRGX_G005538 [Ephydatia muelleri]
MTKRILPSDPEFLLKFMDDIDSDGSDDDFDGYVDDDEQEMDVSDTYIHELGGVYMEVARGADGSMEVPQVGGCYDVSGSGLDSAALEVAQVHGCNDVSGGGLDSAATVEDAFQSEVDVRSEEESSGEVSEGSEEQLKIPRFTEKCGVVKDLSGKQPVDYFLELFHDELQDYIVEESNRYGEQYITSHQAYLTQHPRARANAFVKKPFTRLQFRLFLSLIICMGIVNMPNIQSYWNTSWPFASNNFNEIMSRDRCCLCWALGTARLPQADSYSILPLSKTLDSYKYLGCRIGANPKVELSQISKEYLQDCEAIVRRTDLADWQKLNALHRVRHIAHHELQKTANIRRRDLQSAQDFLNSPPVPGGGDLKSLWSDVRVAANHCGAKFQLDRDSIHCSNETVGWGGRKNLCRLLRSHLQEIYSSRLAQASDQGRVRCRAGEDIADVSCPKCHEKHETLARVLNHCSSHVSLLHHRHSKILGRLVNAIPAWKGQKLKEQVLPGNRSGLKADLIILNEQTRPT